MKLALLMGNRFSAWHLAPFARLGADVHPATFRAESEIQQYFNERDDGRTAFALEPICFDTDAGPLAQRLYHRVARRLWDRQPRILPFALRLQGYDIIQSWELFTDWSAQALEAHEKYGVPLSIMVWDNIPFNMEYNPERRALKQRIARAADRFIVHTERSRRVLDIEGVDEKRILKVDPGIDLDTFSPGPPVRERFGLHEDDFVILFVGWLLPRKGLDFLLLALRELVKDPALQHHRYRLLVIGSGPGRDRVESLAGRLGIDDAVRYAGSVPYNEMPEAFRSADAFVLPSIATPEWQEQFGMSLIEAMACGVPVVSTYTGAVPEIMEDAGILCQPNDFVALYDALKRLSTEPALREDLSAKGRDLACARYDVRVYAAALRALYDGMR